MAERGALPASLAGLERVLEGWMDAREKGEVEEGINAEEKDRLELLCPKGMEQWRHFRQKDPIAIPCNQRGEGSSVEPTMGCHRQVQLMRRTCRRELHAVAWEAQRTYLTTLPKRWRRMETKCLWHPSFQKQALQITLQHAKQRDNRDNSTHSATAIGHTEGTGARKRAKTTTFARSVQATAEDQSRTRLKLCGNQDDMEPLQFVEHLRKHACYANQITHERTLPKRSPSYAPFPSNLTNAVRQAAEGRGAASLFAHQEKAVSAALGGKHVVVSTATASGKSICAHLPVFQTIVEDPNSCAMYIFPTKALAQDQAHSLKEMAMAVLGPTASQETVAVFDGDTPVDARGDIVRSARVWITNPDMIHVTMLPNHKRFARLLCNLRYLVIDEAHAYGGIFGSHVALVLRRLCRICRRTYGISPTTIVLSATLPNPASHAAILTGVSPFEVVDQDSSPCGSKLFLLWNPPLVRGIAEARNRAEGKRRAEQEAQRQAKRDSRAVRGAGARLGAVTDAQFQEELAIGSCKSNPVVSRSYAPGSPAGWDNAGAAFTSCRARPVRVLARGVPPSSGAHDSGASSQGKTTTSALDEEGRQFPDWRKARHGAAGTRTEDHRVSPIVETAFLLAECVQHGLRTIAFCATRKLCELVLSYATDFLRDVDEGLVHRVSVYRGGYSAEERRKVEGRLFRGDLLGVAATNALELGVDIGSLDVTLHLGFPGSYASFKQQAGRAGRREQTSLGIFVAWDGPLDQYFVRHPEKLFGGSVEDLCVDPTNEVLLEQHLMCAAAEIPLDAHGSDVEYFTAAARQASEKLIGKGILGRHPKHPLAQALHYIGGEEMPARQVSLREINCARYVVIEEGRNKVLEEIEEQKAFFQIYEGAIYMHQGRTYHCHKLDLDSRIAYVRPLKVDYYTSVADYTDIQIVGGTLAFPERRAKGGVVPSSSSISARAIVTQRWFGYNSFRKGSGICFDSAELFLPDLQYETIASYIRVPHWSRQKLRDEGLPWREGLHGACHALLNIVPLYVMCGRNDLGTQCDNPYDTRYRPERILVFDKHPGGVGLSTRVGSIFSDLLERALELVSECPCTGEAGCPACIQYTGCVEYNSVLHKGASIRILECTVQEEKGVRTLPSGE